MAHQLEPQLSDLNIGTLKLSLAKHYWLMKAHRDINVISHGGHRTHHQIPRCTVDSSPQHMNSSSLYSSSDRSYPTFYFYFQQSTPNSTVTIHTRDIRTRWEILPELVGVIHNSDCHFGTLNSPKKGMLGFLLVLISTSFTALIVRSFFFFYRFLLIWTCNSVNQVTYF